MSQFFAMLGVMIIGWAVGIEPRLQVQKSQMKDLKELLQVQLTNIDKRLERIERNTNGKGN